ncbi:MAG: hypothetical protein ACLQU4_16360 [Limisphaerales bacterium]
MKPPESSTDLWERDRPGRTRRRLAGGIQPTGVLEFLGICILALLAVWFLHESWRKWADPIIDSGPQWYAIWRVSLGAAPYHDFTWYYGPLSLLFNGLLFKCFGPGMMLLAAANLAVYAAIVTLACLAFRMAWGRLAAFAALAVFISVFSFSMLNSVSNYNYALPYSNETTHGMLLLLVTAFVMTRWCGQPSRAGAFLLGLCGGVAAVLKPEFMLAGGVLGIAAVLLRYGRKQPVSLAEYGMLLAGVALPTVVLTAWFAHRESWQSALIDSCEAWWLLAVNHTGTGVMNESAYMGYDNGWRNVWWELEFTLCAVLTVGAIWAAGWFVNRPWSWPVRLTAALGAGFLACSVSMGGGFEIGPCLPGLILIIFIIVMARVVRELRQTGRVQERNVMALALVLLAGAMLVRMGLRARINHFGFIQAAFAGMVATAVIVSEVPRWTGNGRWGRRVALAAIMAMLALGCGAVVAESAGNHAAQTQSVGSGADRFYAFNPKLDETGSVVNWCVERLRSIPPGATLLVLPEGVMINYLTRHERPMPEFVGDEDGYLKQLARVRPDYVVCIWGDQRDNGIPRFGDPGQPGEKIVKWLRENYAIEDTHQGRTKWAFIFHVKRAP